MGWDGMMGQWCIVAAQAKVEDVEIAALQKSTIVGSGERERG